jgi:TatD DNase family protein
MNLIDTHAHIYLEAFDADRDDVLKHARQAGIETILMPNIDLQTVDRMHRLADQYPDRCLPMMGLHPTSVHANCRNVLMQIKSLFLTRKYLAVGEIGLDLYWDKSFLREQIIAFEEQLKWSIDLQLPVVIHCREAFRPVMESIRRTGGKHLLRGVFHSFGGSPEELAEILSLESFFVGVNGVVTFRNSQAGDAIRRCPLDRLVVETDAPYLTPVPHRGRRNEPAYVRFTVAKLAELFHTDVETIASCTTENARRLFGLS